jgi:hypothetical protein
MEIEERIRTRIEAILINDARNHAEMARTAGYDGEPLREDPFGDERNLYQRMISSYRSAIKEVNSLLEEHVSLLSGFYRFIEAIKDKKDVEEICAHIVDCILQDLGAEYCTLIFCEDEQTCAGLHLEGIREDRRFVRIHSKPELLGSGDLEKALVALSADSTECRHIDDVYREPEFLRLDFPSLVRSLVCVPVCSNRTRIGLLAMSHSCPHYFNDNHIRVLKILASYAAHIRLAAQNGPSPPAIDRTQHTSVDVISLSLLDFEICDSHGRWVPPDRGIVQHLRGALLEALEGRGSLTFHGELSLLLLLPGIPSEKLHSFVRMVKDAFERWREAQNDPERSIRMHVGCATCDGDDDFERVLEVASHLMHPEIDDESHLDAGVR